MYLEQHIEALSAKVDALDRKVSDLAAKLVSSAPAPAPSAAAPVSTSPSREGVVTAAAAPAETPLQAAQRLGRALVEKKDAAALAKVLKSFGAAKLSLVSAADLPKVVAALEEAGQ